MADRELPLKPPRPLAYLLPKAIQAFIEADWTDRTKMLVPAWAATFHCGVEDVRGEYEKQMTTKSLSGPDNQFDSEGK